MNTDLLRWIEGRKPALVAAAEKYVAQYKIAEPSHPGGRDPRISTAQLRNLQNAAQAEAPLAVLRNFLRYQVGRGKRGWPDPPSGEALVELLEQEVGARLAGHRKLEDESRLQAEASLAALLFGYIVREYTYRVAVHKSKGRSR